MKKITILLATVFFTLCSFSQAPEKMSYQAIVRNPSGILQANQAVRMRISILPGSTTGTAVYIETHSTSTNANGLITLEIGGGAIVSGNFSGIDWSNGIYFIKTETDPSGGTNYSLTGTSQILSVPYALYSKTAKTADYNNLTNKPTLFDGSWLSLIGRPTTLVGYGISDAISTSHPSNGITSNMILNWNTAYGWGNHSGLYKLDAYLPSWVEITGKPLFATVATSGAFADLLAKPTTISGYGIIDAVTTSGDQTIAGNKTFTGIISMPTPVNSTDAATKAYVDALLTQIQELQSQPGIVKDVDGNLYTTYKVGNQVWMGENLKTIKYNDGTYIPRVTDNTEWSILTTPGYCWYDNNETFHKATYGALYNWQTVNTGKLCPTGWHVPTRAEWTTLTMYLGGANVAGGKLKENGFAHWSSPNYGATNETSFTALPGGFRFDDGRFGYMSREGNWWTATEMPDLEYGSYYIFMGFDYVAAHENSQRKEMGYSVRCLRD